MNSRFVILFAALLVAGSALAQAPTQTGQDPHQPSVARSQPEQGITPVRPGPPAVQKVDPDKEKAIRHFMDLTGAARMGTNMTEMISKQVQSAMSRNLPADRLQKFMDDFTQKLTVRAPANEIADAQIPIYAQHFSMDDLEGMIHFYESPVGQRMLKALPQVLEESQNTGADIERSAALATLKDMSTDYPELKTMLPPEQQKPSIAPGAQPPKPQQPPAPQR
ncbi:MAG TPA: DUF2059 domain-containing protein [Candidatus Cybelea sp.]|nr:DUF2059 domain-containing protein [Candidatus Cybelea sp.]